MAKRLPCAIQVPMLQRRFTQLNPDVGADVIDWRSACGSKETFEETLQDLKYEYPQWRWEKSDVQREDKYSQMALEDLNRQAKEFDGTCLPSRELNVLKKKATPRRRVHKGPCKEYVSVEPKPYRKCVRW